MELDPDIPFVKLLTEHQSTITSFVITLLPGAPGVDDVIQEINTLLWTKRSQFEIGTNFRAWALTVARFQVLVHLRGLKQQRWVTLDEDVAAMVADELEEHPDPDPTERKIEALRSCLEKLRPGDRELIMQRYWRKEPLQSFAESHGRSLNGLKVQLFRLRVALKRCVQDRLTQRCLP